MPFYNTVRNRNQNALNSLPAEVVDISALLDSAPAPLPLPPPPPPSNPISLRFHKLPPGSPDIPQAAFPAPLPAPTSSVSDLPSAPRRVASRSVVPPAAASPNNPALTLPAASHLPLAKRPATTTATIAPARPRRATQTDKNPTKQITQTQLTPFARFWRKFGADSLLLSIGIHAFLFIIALTWVVAVVVTNEKKPEEFVTGSGGGNNGDVVSMKEHRLKPKRNNPVRSPVRITSKSPTATLVTPEMPVLNMNSLTKGIQSGNISKGLGGGAGGGIGGGLGMGSGGGKNNVGKFFAPKTIMGTAVRAQNLAVYLDASGSMTPYLPAVKKEIYKQFPEADIYEGPSILITVNNGKVKEGRNAGAGGVPARSRGFVATEADEENTAPKSTARRTAILEKWGANFVMGSVGAWMDIMLFEEYDALIIFSDFQDGILEDGVSKESIFFAQLPDGQKKNKKTRPKGSVSEWEREWLTRCADRQNGPRIYLFSINTPPQSIWERCAEISGGKSKMVTHLTKLKPTRRASSKK